MTATIEKEFSLLTVAERVNLVEELWERIASEPEKYLFLNGRSRS